MLEMCSLPESGLHQRTSTGDSAASTSFMAATGTFFALFASCRAIRFTISRLPRSCPTRPPGASLPVRSSREGPASALSSQAESFDDQVGERPILLDCAEFGTLGHIIGYVQSGGLPSPPPHASPFRG
jgi:hypothetical protein